MKKILIIGGGAMGSAFTIPCLENKNDVTITEPYSKRFIKDLSSKQKFHSALKIKLPGKLKFRKFSNNLIKEKFDLLVIALSLPGIDFIGKKALEKGINMIDAPVSGGPRGAREGTIAIMVGGEDKLYEQILPTLKVISSNIFHAGPVGAGHALKAGNNLLNLICRMASFEVVSLLINAGVDAERAVDILQKSSGRNYATEITLPDNILSGKMHQGFSMALMQKDAGLALAMAATLQQAMPLGDTALNALQTAIDAHGMDADMSLVALSYEDVTGARIRP